MKNNKLEIRTFASLRTAPKSDFVLEGLACRYNALSADLGGFRERVLPGAFELAVASRSDVKCLFNHDQNRVLGRVQNGTLTLSDTPDGLAFRCQLDPNNTEHRNLHASVKRGDINECSWAFSLEDGDDSFENGIDEDGNRFTIRSIRNVSNLMDVSAVVSPAYPGATSVSARAATTFVNKLFPASKMTKSFEQQFVDANDYDPWLTQYRSARIAVEIRRDASLYAGSDAGLRDRLERLGRQIELEELFRENL